MKTNQLKTITTRQPSILHPNKGFTYVVWYDVINRINGLTYTEKQFILFILDNMASHNGYQNPRHFISANDIMKEAFQVFIHMQISITSPCHSFSSRTFEVHRVKRHMICTDSGIRIQKFVRHMLSCILTEREIRSICKTYTKRYPEKYNKIHNIKPFIRYVIKKMNVFGARLLQKIYQNGTQLIHIAEPKSYFATRRAKFTQYYLNNFHNYLFPYEKNLIPYTRELCKDIIICYDSYMDRYLKYAALDFSSNIATKIISNSLLDDIISYLKNDIQPLMPKSIKNDTQKVIDTRITLNKMISYAECMRLMPASQNDDRHFTINSRGDMSYTPAKKPTYLNESMTKWLAGQDRMVAKYGKGVKKLFQHYPETIPDFIIEIICNQLKSQHQFCGTFETFTGDDIVKWYSYKQHHRTKPLGSLGNSCMKHESCSEYIKFYAENNDVVSMIAIIEDEKIVSRALLWKTNCGADVLDRIYGNDKYIAIMKQYAKEKGYITKARQSYEDTKQWVNPIGETFNRAYQINVKYYRDRKLPYMDTFYAAKKTDLPATDEYMHMTLHNDNVTGSGCCRSTSGSMTGDMVNFNNGADTTDESNRAGMAQTQDGEWYPEDEVGFCEHYQEYHHQDELCWSEDDGCYYHTNVAYCVGDYWFCSENDYDNHIWSEHRDDYIWMDDSVAIHNQNGNIIDYTDDPNSDDIAYCDRNDYYMHDSDVFYCDITEQTLSREFLQRIQFIDSGGGERNWMISNELDIDRENNFEGMDERIRDFMDENNYTIQY